jgi:hypothetical protein
LLWNVNEERQKSSLKHNGMIIHSITIEGLDGELITIYSRKNESLFVYIRKFKNEEFRMEYSVWKNEINCNYRKVIKL